MKTMWGFPSVIDSKNCRYIRRVEWIRWAYLFFLHSTRNPHRQPLPQSTSYEILPTYPLPVLPLQTHRHAWSFTISLTGSFLCARCPRYSICNWFRTVINYKFKAVLKNSKDSQNHQYLVFSYICVCVEEKRSPASTSFARQYGIRIPFFHLHIEVL